MTTNELEDKVAFLEVKIDKLLNENELLQLKIGEFQTAFQEIRQDNDTLVSALAEIEDLIRDALRKVR